MKLIDFITRVSNIIDIDRQILIDLSKNVNINKEIPDDIVIKLKELLIIDNKIRKIVDGTTDAIMNTKFIKLKNNLAKLQILILLKKISNTDIGYEALQTLLDVFKDKIHVVNEILLQQGGGKNTREKAYYKYLKYLVKYVRLKYIS